MFYEIFDFSSGIVSSFLGGPFVVHRKNTPESQMAIISYKNTQGCPNVMPTVDPIINP